jgi:hypothetical protein
MKLALACGTVLATLSLLSMPASAAPAVPSSAGGVLSVPDLQAAGPKKKAAAKKHAKAKKARSAAGKK